MPLHLYVKDVSDSSVRIELDGKAAQLLLTMKNALVIGRLLWIQNFGLDRRLGQDAPFCFISRESNSDITKVQVLAPAGQLCKHPLGGWH